MIIAFFSYLVQVSVCLALFYFFYHLALRKDTFFQLNRVYLLGALFVSLLIPYFNISLPTEQSTTSGLYLGFDELIVEGMSTVMTGQFTEQAFNYEYFFLGIYSLGVLFFSFKLLLSLLYIFGLMIKNKVIKEEGYYLVQLEDNLPVFSFLHFIFWNNKLSYTSAEAEQIMLHEQVHVQQKHSWDILFAELLSILLWFNPLLHFYKRSLKDIHEYIADYQLFEGHRYQIRYVDLLMKEAKAQQRKSLPVVHTFFNNQLKKRLIMIRNTNKRSSKFKFIGCLPILALLFFSFGFEQSATAQSSDEDKKSPQSGNIFVAGDTDNEFTLKADGSRRTTEEIKKYIVQKNLAEGKIVNKDQIFVISKNDMMRNVNAKPAKELPLLTDEFKVVFIKSLGKLMFVLDDGKQLAIKSFNGTIQKPDGLDKNGKQQYITFSINFEGDQLNKAAMDMINEIPTKDLVTARFMVNNIVVLKEQKEYKVAGDYPLSLE